MDQHKKVKRILQVVGITTLLIGIVFALIGFIDFFNALQEGMPERFWCLFVGMPLIGIGASLLGVGFKREVMKYMEKESAPVVNEAAKDMAPAVKTVAAAVKEAVSGSEKGKTCACGCENEADGKFCKNCGAPLECVCAHCGASVATDSMYCAQCGAKLK